MPGDDISAPKPALTLTRVGIVAGEASGDILAAGLIRELKRRYPHCEFEGVGGPRMIAAGFRTLYAMDRLAVMGLVDPLKRLPELLSMRRNLRKHFTQSPPDIFIGVDAPDFNLTLEEHLRATGVITVHYVSPSVWAWRQGRVKKIARAVDLILTLFPFEAAFYRTHDVTVTCVGHTLADELPLNPDVHGAREKLGLQLNPNDKVVALMPGSRAGEVKYLCSVMLQAAVSCLEKMPNLVFLVPAANKSRYAQIERELERFPKLPVLLYLRQSHEVMTASDVVLMASGTTTLEAMLLKKPMVVAYKMAALSFAILKRIVKSPFVGIPNLLAQKSVVPELLQDEATPEKMAAAILDWLQNPEKVEGVKAVFTELHYTLKRNADVTAADAICSLVTQKKQVLSNV